MADYLLIIPLFLAVAAGWWLGRRDSAARALTETQVLGRDYFAGLDYLVNERTDEAIESFIRSLECNSDSLSVHLTLAKLLRKKGEFEQAIQLHRGVLDRPGLASVDVLRIQIALARDYDAAGLLDRAETLLQDIIGQAPPQELLAKALRLLIKLYEKEGEWQQALAMAERLDPEYSGAIAHELAHYCCELAEECLRQGDHAQAGDFVRQALQHDAQSVRASFLLAQLQVAQCQWKSAIRALKRVVEQDPLFVSETLASLQRCYCELDQMKAYEGWLRQAMSRTPSTSVMLALAERVREDSGVYSAAVFVTEALKKRPSIKGFNRLIDMHIEHGSPSVRESLRVLKGLTGRLEQSKPVYCCSHCGFSGRLLLWQCPSCKNWGTIKPIQGLEGE